MIMSLVSYEFLAFFAAAAILYYVVPKRFQWIMLLAVSFLFYAGGGAVYLLYPMITAVSTWFLALRIGRVDSAAQTYIQEQKPDKEQKKAYQAQIRKQKKRLMTTGILLNFGILVVLKYTDFLLGNLHVLLGPEEGAIPQISWVLPLGISYYTFQTMGYLIDVFRGRYRPEKNLFRFMLFVTYFPQMVSGPISRFDQLRKELFEEHPFDGTQFTFGLWRVLWGFFKKLVIADRIAPAVATITAAPDVYDGIYVLVGMLGYTLQLYADFSGCMDIVIGVSQCFGIRLPENFQRPFGAKNLSEFWRRWHMTLTGWFREYIFFPVSTSRFCRAVSRLAGRLGMKKVTKKLPVYIANLIVWFVTGIWHGAAWGFILWGLANGIVMMVSQELTELYRAFHRRFPQTDGSVYGAFQKVRTGLLFSGLLMFQYYPFGTVFAMLGNLLATGRLSQLFDGRFAELGLTAADFIVLAIGLLLMLLISILQETGSVRQKLAARPLVVRFAAVFLLFVTVLVAGCYGHGYNASQFIYNQF